MLHVGRGRQLGCAVADKTGLAVKYDLTPQWIPGGGQVPMFKGAESVQQRTDERLGQKLEAKKGPVKILGASEN